MINHHRKTQVPPKSWQTWAKALHAAALMQRNGATQRRAAEDLQVDRSTVSWYMACIIQAGGTIRRIELPSRINRHIANK